MTTVPPAPGKLCRGSDIRRVLAGARPAATGRVAVYSLPNQDGARAAFVCGRRIGSAADRNRARRVLREAWRSVQPRIGGGFDVVLVARPSIEGAKTQDVVEDLDRALAAAGVIRS